MKIDSMYFRLWFKGSTLEKNSFVIIELIHLLWKGRFILWVAPIEKWFRVMSNAISLDNQTFLSSLVDSFINFFQLQKSQLFPYFSFISNMVGSGGGGGGGRRPGSDRLLGGATGRGSVDPGLVFSFKKTIKPSMLLVKDQFIHYYLSTCTCQLTYHHFNSCTAQKLLVVQKIDF